jgi:hypothetical protein
MYFCICFILSWYSGVLKTVVNSPLVTDANLDNPAWLTFTALCAGIVAFAYLYWWPKGTVTHGRKLYLLPTLFFGTVWGLSEGQLFLSVYALTEDLGLARLYTALIAFAVIGAFNGVYHANWWDIYISPPHNIRAWNMKMFGHNPNLIITMAYLTIFGSAGIYLIFQTVALAASSIFMRFPPFWVEDGGEVSKETGLGI